MKCLNQHQDVVRKAQADPANRALMKQLLENAMIMRDQRELITHGAVPEE